jgi:hypothetical protein
MPKEQMTQPFSLDPFLSAPPNNLYLFPLKAKIGNFLTPAHPELR